VFVHQREKERMREREIKKNEKLNCVRKLKCQVRDILEERKIHSSGKTERETDR
jgi:hypothetical protein